MQGFNRHELIMNKYSYTNRSHFYVTTYESLKSPKMKFITNGISLLSTIVYLVVVSPFQEMDIKEEKAPQNSIEV